MNKSGAKIDTKIIGLMSVTSLDGIDICFVHFKNDENKCQYEIELAESISYPEEIKNQLASIHLSDLVSFAKFDSD